MLDNLNNPYVKQAIFFVNMIKNIKLEKNDLLVSFDVVSLFTKIPINEAVEVINEITDQETAKLVEICLKSTFFSFQGEIYEQTCGVAMRSPQLSSICLWRVLKTKPLLPPL